jgi:hypothetical protein
MSDYSSSVLLEARAIQKEKYYQKFEGRQKNSMIVDAFFQNRDMMFPDLAAIKEASAQATKMLYPVKSLLTIGSAKSCTPTGVTEDSGIVTLTWATKTATVKISNKVHDGNEFKMASTLARQLLDAEIDLFKNGAASLEVALLAYLEANRSQVATGAHFTWDGSNYNLDCPFASLTNFYNFLLDDLKINNYNGMFLDVYNTAFGGYIRSQANQGQSNATNTAFQFMNPFDFQGFDSNLIIPSTSDLSTHYVIPEGGVTILDWNDPVNRNGAVSGEKTWGLYQSRLFPGLTFDLFHVTACEDTTSIGGTTQDITHTYELAFNYSLAKAPLSSGTPIIKVNILAS